ncbi:MAG: hypothetical protein HRF42_10810 [Candidatus Brocadia sp.]
MSLSFGYDVIFFLLRYGRPLWIKHPDEDVAAMYISLSDGVDISLLGTTIFADDDTFNEYEIHLGLVGLLIQQASLKENLFLEMNCTLLA